MGRLLSITLVLSAALAVVAAAWAGPRDEKERLTKADMASARRALLRQSDLSSGWKRIAIPKSSTRCPSYNPDFSRFTITGKAHTGFMGSGGAAIASSVSIYRNGRQAAAAFELGARPALLSCITAKMVRLFAASQIRASIVSRRMSTGPRLGTLSASFRLVLRLRVGSQTSSYHVDLLTFQVRRAIGAISFQALDSSVRNQIGIARRVSARLQRVR